MYSLVGAVFLSWHTLVCLVIACELLIHLVYITFVDGYQIVVINIVLITLCYSGVALSYELVVLW